MANIRGGGEYGYEWHKAGMYPTRHKIFEDFEAPNDHMSDHPVCPSLAIARGGFSIIAGNLLLVHAN